MKRLLFLVGLLALFALPFGRTGSAAAPGAVEEGPRLFYCSHSFMNFTGGHLRHIVPSAGITYRNAGGQFLSGSRVIEHWELPEPPNKAKPALREGRVDVLVLSPHFDVPDEGIDLFTLFGLQTNPNLLVYLQSSWPKHDNFGPRFQNSARNLATVEDLRQQRDHWHSTWLPELEDQVATLNTVVGGRVVHILPVSHAVYALRMEIARGQAPGLTLQSELFRDGAGHANAPLQVLVAYVHFATIYQRNPIGLAVPRGLSAFGEHAEALNRLLQEIAWDAVSNYPQP